jgi:hypothetical protein
LIENQSLYLKPSYQDIQPGLIGDIPISVGQPVSSSFTHPFLGVENQQQQTSH